MIVKDESHVIESTLKNLCKYIKFSYYVICDTGSSDSTQEIIKNFFKLKNIPGEIHNDPWQDFGTNRSLALSRAHMKSDYLLVFDADDSIIGTFVLPKVLDKDSYMLTFGNKSMKYNRMCLVKNNSKKLKWKYHGVLHEYINSEVQFTSGVISGNYYIVSGKSGARNNDPNKYLKDAKILETAYHKALQEKDPLSNRYVYYCANSYFDAGDYEKAIEWYLLTLKSFGWSEERYNACLRLFELLNKKNDFSAYYYLVKSINYSNERVECIFELIKHYVCEKEYSIAYNYYLLIQDYYENRYSVGKDDLSTKLFARTMDYSFYLPYYLIILCENIKKYDLGIKMYLIIFEKRSIPGGSQSTPGEWWINNLLFNARFYVNKLNNIPSIHNTKEKLKDYVKFLDSSKINYDRKLLIPLGIIEKSNIPEKSNIQEKNNIPEKSNIQSIPSIPFRLDPENTILIYTGFSVDPWNISYTKDKPVGGSERAIIELSKELSNYYTIIISGNLLEEYYSESKNPIFFVNMNNLRILLENNTFKAIIISRFISFFECFKKFSCQRLIIMAHDTYLLNNLIGSNKPDTLIIEENINKIDSCVCLTEYHKQLYSDRYPLLQNKINIINNGIVNNRAGENIKVKNSFIYSSCAERGLERLLELWPEILLVLPDATLNICSYNHFPTNDSEEIMNNTIKKYSESIKHLGKLNQSDLYGLMKKTEYWLYPCCFLETSCITGMELLMHEVICLYYPIGGLSDTMKDYGLQVNHSNEISTLMGLTDSDKQNIRKRGLEYANDCSWKNRSIEWIQLIRDPSGIK